MIRDPAVEPRPDAPGTPHDESVPDAWPVAAPPRFRVRVFWTPKRGNSEAEWEDGFAFDTTSGLLAVADGASDGVFTKPWVKLLLESFIARPVQLDDPEQVESWLEEQRLRWFAALGYPRLRWSLQKRVDTSCGGATFLAFRLDPEKTSAGSDEPGLLGWTAWAVGDVCLFHARDGYLIAMFPIERSSDFGYTPQLYQSRAWLSTPIAHVLRGEIRPGDLMLFATDALAQRMMAASEAGVVPDWGRLRALDLETWRGEIEDLRDRGEITNDDCTLLVLELSAPTADRPDLRSEFLGESEGTTTES